jgi:hypothetical protein
LRFLERTALRYCEYTRLRGCLHVSESVYNSAYDYMHDLLARQIWIQHPLQWSVYTFQQKTYKKFTCGTLLAANCTLNRTPIRVQNRTRRQTLGQVIEGVLVSVSKNVISKIRQNNVNFRTSFLDGHSLPTFHLPPS